MKAKALAEVIEKLEAMAVPDSEIGAEPHWACPSCSMPCHCEGAARLMLHQDCGLWEL